MILLRLETSAPVGSEVFDNGSPMGRLTSLASSFEPPGAFALATVAAGRAEPGSRLNVKAGKDTHVAEVLPFRSRAAHR